MTDIDNFDYESFNKWAFKMLQTGRCMTKHCIHYSHDHGPMHQNEPCRKCYKDSL